MMGRTKIAGGEHAIGAQVELSGVTVCWAGAPLFACLSDWTDGAQRPRRVTLARNTCSDEPSPG